MVIVFYYKIVLLATDISLFQHLSFFLAGFSLTFFNSQSILLVQSMGEGLDDATPPNPDVRCVKLLQHGWNGPNRSAGLCCFQVLLGGLGRETETHQRRYFIISTDIRRVFNLCSLIFPFIISLAIATISFNFKQWK